MDPQSPINKEGWTWTHNSRKWHYFRDSKSLCAKWMLLVHPREGYEAGNNESTDNCTLCKRKLLLLKVNDAE